MTITKTTGAIVLAFLTAAVVSLALAPIATTSAKSKAQSKTSKCKVKNDLWLKIKVKYEDANGNEVRINKISAKFVSKKKNTSKELEILTIAIDRDRVNWFKREEGRVLGTRSWTTLGRPNVYIHKDSDSGVGVRIFKEQFGGCGTSVSFG